MDHTCERTVKLCIHTFLRTHKKWHKLQEMQKPKPYCLLSPKRSSLECSAHNVQSARQEKVPAGGVGSGAGRGENFTGGWTKGLLMVENSVSHQGVTLLHTD
jgi:hypothetical protein